MYYAYKALSSIKGGPLVHMNVHRSIKGTSNRTIHQYTRNQTDQMSHQYQYLKYMTLLDQYKDLDINKHINRSIQGSRYQ